MLDVQVELGRAYVFAQSDGHQDYAEYVGSAPAVKSALADVERIASVTTLELFEHQWILRVTEAVGDVDVCPAVRRVLSQGLDEAAVRNGLLLRPHWHCPECGAPGSQWTAGCWRPACGYAGPARRAHWDHCRVATRDDLRALIVSEGYDRIGVTARSPGMRQLWRRLGVLQAQLPTELRHELAELATDLRELHVAQAVEYADIAARLASQLDLAGEDLDPESMLQAAMDAAGLTAAPSVAA